MCKLNWVSVFPSKDPFFCAAASVAQLDARPTGDQEVAGSSPAGLATFLRGD